MRLRGTPKRRSYFRVPSEVRIRVRPRAATHLSRLGGLSRVKVGMRGLYGKRSRSQLEITALDGPSALTWALNAATGHEYAVLEDCAGWHACESAAVAEGAHLVTINDGAEQDWLVAQFGGTAHHWIGLSDEAELGTANRSR